MKPRKAQVQQQPVDDGSFPMMSSNASRSSRTSRTSSVRSRGSSSSSYYKQYNDDDIPRPMCGQGALNKILAVSPGVKTKRAERSSLLSPSQEGSQKSYEEMPYDATPMDNIYSSKHSKFSQSFQDPEPSEAMIYIPQFNVNKAKQVQAKRQPKSPSRRRLPSVEEVSREDSTQVSEDESGISLSSARVLETTRKERSPVPAPIPPPKERKSSKDRRIEQMIRSMQDIIMQQEENLNAMGSQNAQYRENMTLFQEHVMNLKKEQVNQKNEIHKLHFERETFEAEATSLREELKTMRSELSRSKSERGTSWTPNGGASPPKAAPWVKKESAANNAASWTQETSSPRQQPAPWTKKDASIEKEAVGKPRSPRSPSKQREPSSPKRQSVSFHEHNELIAEYVQQRDDASSDLRWERSRQRSVFSKNTRGINAAPGTPILTTPAEETREASPRQSSGHSPRHSPRQGPSNGPGHSPSGKCADLRELQARANELRDTVAKMKLESPTNHADHARYSSPKSPTSGGANYSPSPTNYDERKRDAVLRYSRGERGTSYWNSHDMMYKAEDRDDAI